MITLNTRSRLGRAILRLWTPRAEYRPVVRVDQHGVIHLSPLVIFAPAGSPPGFPSPPAQGSGRSGQSQIPQRCAAPPPASGPVIPVLPAVCQRSQSQAGAAAGEADMAVPARGRQ